MTYNDLACNYTKQEILEGYLRAEKPYEVCVHTNMGSYMEFMRLEKNIMFEENAKQIADTMQRTGLQARTSKVYVCESMVY